MVSPLKTFLQSILGLLIDNEAIVELFEIVDLCNKEPRRTATKDPNPIKKIVQPIKPQEERVVEKFIRNVS